MYRSLTGYECEKCHSTELLLKLKDGRIFDQMNRQVQTAK